MYFKICPFLSSGFSCFNFGSGIGGFVGRRVGAGGAGGAGSELDGAGVGNDCDIDPD